MIGEGLRERGEDRQGRTRDATTGTPVSDRALWGGWRTWVLVFGVFVIPILFYAAIPAVVALPISPDRKVAFSVALVVGAEGTFLVSALVLGREAVRRYRCFLDPRTWFGRSGRS